MAEDGDSAYKQMSHRRLLQETFQGAPETQVEHRYPARSTGIISLPPGSRGPRSLYLRRHGDSFGFTLRHFIVYPPDTLQDTGGKNAAVGMLLSPMDTIFVKNVAQCSPAEQAGLQHGDRIVAVNGVSVTDKTYAQVVHFIQHSPEYLHLLVVPKEEDVLQKFFAETAHNPVTNQIQKQEFYIDPKRSLQRPIPHNLRRPGEFYVDAIAWRSLQQSTYGDSDFNSSCTADSHQLKQQRSADDLLYAYPREISRVNHKPQEIIDDSCRRSRAQPQVPLYRKMGRRASEGSTFSNQDIYPSEFLNNFDIPPESDMKSVGKGSYPEASRVGPNMQAFTFPNSPGCRLSLEDGGRRESSSSITSSLVDGSKDSLSSYDSISTLTGQDTDDSVIMTRSRKNLQKKEEFLRTPSHPAAPPMMQREFYGRPKKLDKPAWPPQETSSRTFKPVHQNLQRVKSDIDTERDMRMQIQTDEFPSGGSINEGFQHKGANSPRDWHFLSDSAKMIEASPAPVGLDNPAQIKGAAEFVQDEDRRLYLTNLQMVSKRTKQFESGRPLPEDDLMLKDRTSFYKSELARISSKRVVPHVTIRAHEFESRSTEQRRDPRSNTSGNSAFRRQHRDSRSLDSSGSNASSSSISEVVQSKLSGNVVIPFGSKYIHVPSPSEYNMVQDADNQSIRLRARSNSADSWTASIQTPQTTETARNTFPEHTVGKKAQPQDVSTSTGVESQPHAPLSPLIPIPVELLQNNPSIAITPDPSSPIPAIRPNQLDLDVPIRPARRLQLSHSRDSSPRRSSSPSATLEELRPIVVRRQKNNLLVEEDRAVRRESYLKATGNSRMHVDELSDGEISPHIARSAHRKWRPPLFPGDIQQLRKLFEDAAYSFGGSISGGSSSSISLEPEKTSLPNSPSEKEKSITKEGLLHCKIAEIDGKRATDRSWKQVWVVLRGSKLFLYKDRHHQSPSDAAEQSLVNGVDMKTSSVGIAENYTKRKHVLRVSSIHPCRSELLLQAESPVDLTSWVKALQEQVFVSSDVQTNADVLAVSKQHAEPQMIPASTTIQYPSSNQLLPQPNKSKLPSLRNRSPTGQSPVSKTRKPSQVNEGLTSPKSKTWRGRVAKQFRKIQGATSPSSPTAPEGSTFGVPLEQCFPSNYNQHVPRLVEVCTDIVESKGLDVVGIYRVPGNSAAITALTNSVNQSYEGVPQIDAQWNDVHVVSSLLKSFFRKLPDALLTSGLYSSFIEADKIEIPSLRMEGIRKLVKCLPPHHYYTLRHLMLHLKKVTDNCDMNKMEGRNLAIVFGPTLIRAVQDDMATLVNDMTHNYKIVESLICYAEWFFSNEDASSLNLPLPAPPVDSLNNEFDVASNRALLLDNISKVEGFKGEKVPGRELFSSIISAAHRKMRKGAKTSASQEMKDDLGTMLVVKEFTSHSNFPEDPKHNQNEGKISDIPTTVVDMEKSDQQVHNEPWFKYSNEEHYRRRIKNFIQETEANLQRRKTSDFCSDSLDQSLPSGFTNSNRDSTLRMLSKANSTDSYVLTKTHSASNVLHRPLNGNKTNSSHSAFPKKYSKNCSDVTDNKRNSGELLISDKFDLNQNKELVQPVHNDNVIKTQFRNPGAVMGSPTFIRRGSSVENVNSSIMDLAVNGSMKKLKFGYENDVQRTGSLDSLHKMHDVVDEGGDLQASVMKIFDEKQKILSFLASEQPTCDTTAYQNKENIPASPKLYRNPSLHKSLLSSSKLAKLPNLQDFKLKETHKGKVEDEKDRDCCENVPDNECYISNTEKLALNTTNINIKSNSSINFSLVSNDCKLRRSESLNKPERTVSPLSNRLKRSESLNKASDRLKRSDSLTKNEKTESNINKRRELSASTRRTNKEFTKLKRKNGMPECSIKRRHTVGGTKDFDKVGWLDNRYQEDNNSEKINKEKNSLRTSSPDLSSTRRERLFFEVNLVGPENMVVALRQHLIGARPQSLPEPRIFTVPLESHV